MIKLTRFKTKSHEFVLNAELIESVEETPDTVITLTNGNKVIVEESMDDIVRLVIEYRRELHRFTR
jgi:flagellar protein FlbD